MSNPAVKSPISNYSLLLPLTAAVKTGLVFIRFHFADINSSLFVLFLGNLKLLFFFFLKNRLLFIFINAKNSLLSTFSCNYCAFFRVPVSLFPDDSFYSVAVPQVDRDSRDVFESHVMAAQGQVRALCRDDMLMYREYIKNRYM